MMNYISNVTLSSAIKYYIPRFSEETKAPERKTQLLAEDKLLTKQEKKPKGEIQKVVKTPFKKVDEIPKGPNSIFSLAQFLNRDGQTG